MADIVSREVRSRIMAAVRHRDTKPELTLRRALHARGLRYRLYGSHLSGKPDLVFVKRKAVLFVHGCYWHRHEGCPRAKTPKTNVSYWTAKFAANTQRDRKHIDNLLQAGWRVGIVWECRIGKKVDPEVLDEIEAFLKGQSSTAEWG